MDRLELLEKALKRAEDLEIKKRLDMYNDKIRFSTYQLYVNEVDAIKLDLDKEINNNNNL